jgi:hypothetical protein
MEFLVADAPEPAPTAEAVQDQEVTHG